MFALKEDSLPYLEIEEFSKLGIKAFFSTRLGGDSDYPYSSLNLGLHVGDQPEKVIKNRQKFCQACGVDYKRLVAGEQVHGNLVYDVTKDDQGKGALAYGDSIQGVDALVTDRKGIPLISFYADCVPLYIVDPVKKVVALAHAGWQGTVKKIALKTLTMMKDKFQVDPVDCWAAIGPSISKDYYEVDKKVINNFDKHIDNWQQFAVKRDSSHYLLDLKVINQYLFTKAGIKPSRIIVSKWCTYRDEKYFYSYRRERGKTGRMASLIVL